ncbi:MAG: hypothetical protein J0I87_00115, partial [Cellulomonas sp.]|nr:hypothetical protein [Cellulomonas sp.]
MNRTTIGGAAALAVVALAVSASAASAEPTRGGRAPQQHVLLLSVDGLHQSDLDWYVRQHPG